MSFTEFRSKKIHIFRNGDAHNEAKRLVINTRVYRNYEQFLGRLSQDVPLSTGKAVRKVYTMDGVLVRGLDGLTDGGVYVVTSGEGFKKAPYLTDGKERERERVVARTGAGAGVGAVNGRGVVRSGGSTTAEKEAPIFGPTNKGYRINVFVNGHHTTPGSSIVLNWRNCRTWDQLIKTLVDLVNLPVRRLYEAESGKRVSRLRQLRDGMNVVVTDGQPFKNVPYQISAEGVDRDGNVDTKEKDGDKRERAASTAAGGGGNRRVVTFFPNGDTYHTGQPVTITHRRFPNLHRLLDYLNSKIEIHTGLITKIYALPATPTPSSSSTSHSAAPPVVISEVGELMHGGSYVVASNEPFVRCRYNVNAPLIEREEKGKGLKGETRQNRFMKQIRRIKSRSRSVRSGDVTENETDREEKEKDVDKERGRSAKVKKRANSKGGRRKKGGESASAVGGVGDVDAVEAHPSIPEESSTPHRSLNTLVTQKTHVKSEEPKAAVPADKSVTDKSQNLQAQKAPKAEPTRVAVVERNDKTERVQSPNKYRRVSPPSDSEHETQRGADHGFESKTKTKHVVTKKAAPDAPEVEETVEIVDGGVGNEDTMYGEDMPTSSFQSTTTRTRTKVSKEGGARSGENLASSRDGSGKSVRSTRSVKNTRQRKTVQGQESEGEGDEEYVDDGGDGGKGRRTTKRQGNEEWSVRKTRTKQQDGEDRDSADDNDYDDNDTTGGRRSTRRHDNEEWTESHSTTKQRQEVDEESDSNLEGHRRYRTVEKNGPVQTKTYVTTKEGDKKYADEKAKKFVESEVPELPVKNVS
ncbi:Doublecortin domain-containing protein 2 [Gaertneriomyces sp. JEL0708]|nr:Doublecortin domain-containing protein 2 [Gaertneriomyces sp. JEL0708]